MLGFKKRQEVQRAVRCAHPRTLRRWDNVEDVGRLDRPFRLFCPACGSFLADADPAAQPGPASA